MSTGPQSAIATTSYRSKKTRKEYLQCGTETREKQPQASKAQAQGGKCRKHLGLGPTFPNPTAF